MKNTSSDWFNKIGKIGLLHANGYFATRLLSPSVNVSLLYDFFLYNTE